VSLAERIVKAESGPRSAMSSTGQRFEEAFIRAVAPGTIELQHANDFYKTEEEYLYAIADAMKTEYRTIVDAGFVLQIDDPADGHGIRLDGSDADARGTIGGSRRCASRR
jgi:methionine synthase II (cobalamin-independent)